MPASGPYLNGADEPPTYTLMFSFDGEFGDELCIGLSAPDAAVAPRKSVEVGDPTCTKEGGGTSSPVAGWNGCHKFAPITALLGSQLNIAGQALDPQQHAAAHAKTAQLLMHWVSLPTTETLLHLVFSRARRALPLSRDLLEDRRASRASLPVAPAPMHTRWSVSGGTPRCRPPLASPGASGGSVSEGATPRKRRKSEPTLPTLAFATPQQPPRGRDDASVGSGGGVSTGGVTASTPRRSGGGGPASPGSSGHGSSRAPTASEIVHSPLSYFGTHPDVSSRFLHVAPGDGGTRAFFEDAAGAPGGTLSPEALLTLVTERLDLPRSVGRVVVKRAQRHQKALDEGRPPPSGPYPPTAEAASTSAAAAAAVAPSGSGDAVDDARPIGVEAFAAVFGRHRPEEADKVRLFRLVKSGGPSTPWVLPSDITELVWAVSETHAGLEFLRDSEEFLQAYVQTTSLRIMWALGGSATGRITLQAWRHSSITEVLFQLDDEGDINLARDYFSYNHFYVVWCLFWELDEDEDSLLQKADLLRYGADGLSPRVVDRIWALRRETGKGDGMTYSDFVWFLLAEEDKQSNAALQYWFHALDCDGDGYLGTADMLFFYEEMQTRLEAMNEEVVPFSELANELFDLVCPSINAKISLGDLKRCALGFNVVSALTNVRKYIAWEGLSCEKAAGRASNLRDTRDWDLFADSEYRRLVETEDGGEQQTGAAGDDGAEDDTEAVEQKV